MHPIELYSLLKSHHWNKSMFKHLNGTQKKNTLASNTFGGLFLLSHLAWAMHKGERSSTAIFWSSCQIVSMHSMNTHLHVLRVQSIELRSADSQIFKVVSKYCVVRWLGISVLTGITVSNEIENRQSPFYVVNRATLAGKKPYQKSC